MHLSFQQYFCYVLQLVSFVLKTISREGVKKTDKGVVLIIAVHWRFVPLLTHSVEYAIFVVQHNSDPRHMGYRPRRHNSHHRQVEMVF